MSLIYFLFLSQLSLATEAITLIGVGEHFPLFRFVRLETQDTFVAFTKLKNSCELQNIESPPFMEWYQQVDPRRGRLLVRQERLSWKARYPAQKDDSFPKERFTFSLLFPKSLRPLMEKSILNGTAEVFVTRMGNTCYSLLTFRRKEKPSEILRLDSILVSGEGSGIDPEKVTLLGANLSTGKNFELSFSLEGEEFYP